MKFSILKSLTVFAITASLTACSKGDDNEPITQNNTITIENVLASQPLVQSATFTGSDTPPVIFPGQSVSFSFYAAKNQTLTFASMYGFSNDWFFATKGNGIDASQLVDISTAIGLYDNGTAIDQFPGAGITQFNLEGTPLEESKAIQAVPQSKSVYNADSYQRNH